jgi:hypothetical protein
MNVMTRIRWREAQWILPLTQKSKSASQASSFHPGLEHHESISMEGSFPLKNCDSAANWETIQAKGAGSDLG